MNEAIIIMAKASQVGPMGRGQAGKKKVYEIRVSGNVVTFSWGMAEKTQRQTQRITTTSFQAAMRIANEKKWAKRDRGYQVVLAA